MGNAATAHHSPVPAHAPSVVIRIGMAASFARIRRSAQHFAAPRPHRRSVAAPLAGRPRSDPHLRTHQPRHGDDHAGRCRPTITAGQRRVPRFGAPHEVTDRRARRPSGPVCASSAHGLSGDGVEQQRGLVRCVPALRVRRDEGEQPVELACERVGAAVDAGQPPVVLDEPRDRRLVGDGVVDDVGFGPWRDHQQGQAGAVAAAALLSGQGGAVAARPGAGEGVGHGGGRVARRARGVVVPAVGVVVGDDDGRGGPGRGLLQGVDLVDEEALLVERVGVGGVAVLVARGLAEADGRQRGGWEVATADGGDELVEVIGVVLVVGDVDCGTPALACWVSVPTVRSASTSTVPSGLVERVRWWGLAVDA